MVRLVLINGAPGSGKSTLAHDLAQDVPLMLAVDVDASRHSFGQWQADPSAAGLLGRRLAHALIREHLAAGHDVVVGQYLAKTDFIVDLEETAQHHGAQFVEVVLDLDAAILARRLSDRVENPDRPKHEVNNLLVGPEDAEALTGSLANLRRDRPAAFWVDASGSRTATLERLRVAVSESR